MCARLRKWIQSLCSRRWIQYPTSSAKTNEAARMAAKGMSGLREAEPLLDRGRPRPGERVEERARLVADDEQLAVLAAQESLGDGVVEERGEALEVAAHVEEADRLGVDAELRP